MKTKPLNLFKVPANPDKPFAVQTRFDLDREWETHVNFTTLDEARSYMEEIKNSDVSVEYPFPFPIEMFYRIIHYACLVEDSLIFNPNTILVDAEKIAPPKTIGQRLEGMVAEGRISANNARALLNLIDNTKI